MNAVVEKVSSDFLNIFFCFRKGKGGFDLDGLYREDLQVKYKLPLCLYIGFRTNNKRLS